MRKFRARWWDAIRGRDWVYMGNWRLDHPRIEDELMSVLCRVLAQWSAAQRLRSHRGGSNIVFSKLVYEECAEYKLDGWHAYTAGVQMQLVNGIWRRWLYPGNGTEAYPRETSAVPAYLPAYGDNPIMTENPMRRMTSPC